MMAPGAATVTDACATETGHSVPIAFQNSSSWSAKPLRAETDRIHERVGVQPEIVSIGIADRDPGRPTLDRSVE